MSYTLLSGDVLVLGSDGKDDIQIHTEDQEEINEQEDLFLQILESSEGDLQKAVEKIESNGKILDDLSLLKITFDPKYYPTNSNRINDYLSLPFKKVLEMIREKEWERALPFVLSYSHAEPENPKVWNTLGVIYFHKKNTKMQSLLF
jgi:hypothetical protein